MFAPRYLTIVLLLAIALLTCSPTLAQIVEAPETPLASTTTHKAIPSTGSAETSASSTPPAASTSPTLPAVSESAYGYLSSFFYGAEEPASPAVPVVKPFDWKTVAYAFIPEPTVFRMFVLAVLVSVGFSPKVRKSLMTYGGVAGICAWYAFRKALFRKEVHHKRRESIRINRTPSPKKGFKKPVLDTVAERKADTVKSPKSKSPLGKIFGSGKKKN